ncbi:hypothetical protein [Mycetocola saprophilus]|uniref:hypothetical protein n=1 Tax=Mycetocola saprophilus TaxID=76636 RepID=UPI003BF30D72
MATRRFELTTSVAARPEDAIDFLMDLRRQHGLHPFLVSAEIFESDTAGHTPWFRWRIHERPGLGPIRYSIRFTARMSRLSAISMVGEVQAAPGCTLTSETRARVVDTEEGSHTVLHEITTVSAPRLLLGYMWSQARRAHARVYAALPQEFDPR